MDIYYSTGGKNLVGGGSDVWVNHWVDEIQPKLDRPSKLVIHQDNDVKKDLDEADRIHILHGYYTPNQVVLDYKDKIYSNVMHVELKKSLNAHKDLELPLLKHFNASIEYEKDILNIAKKTIWIGLYESSYHNDYDIIDIPNFYEFNEDGITIDSNRVGFCSRMETRKAPHFLNDIDSYFFTNVEHFAWWRENLNYNFTKTKLFQFQYKNLKKFLRRDDWGISHSAHIHEPFGYSIFQAVDYGKIPILSEDWLHEIEYPFRASTKEDFEECWKQICKLDVNQRQDYIDYLKDKLIKFTDKKQWVDKYLEIYNS
jgi:hypothetical protein|tara:strand:+ start:434 stop:1372 length:939 start_codon:yes stop_codon:yes gene_type:complete